jgi:alpha-D-xyloside xylohydrolase
MTGLPRPSGIVSWRRDAHALVLRTDGALIALEPRTHRTVRIRCTRDAALSQKPSLIVTPAVAGAPAVAFDVVERPTDIVFSTSGLSIEIDRRTTAFTYRDASGALLTSEPVRGGKTLDPVEVLVSVFDDSTTVEGRATPDGVRVDALNVRQVVDRHAYHTKLEFEWADGEALYGLGSHEEGMFNLRGQHQYLYQQNMKAAIPVILSSRGYGVVVDCTSAMTFHDDAFGSYLWSDVDEELDYSFIVGPEFDTIVAEIRELTGRAPMLPRWAFGYIQSKEHYASQDELLEVAREYRRRGVPLDCVVLDWKSWTGDLWGQKTLDPERFPDPDRLTSELHALGVRLMVSIWPTMQPGGDDWRELSAGGHLLGNQATYDAYSEAARAVYWSQANRGIFSHGADAWWADCSEPFEADWSGAVKPEPEDRMRINTDEAKRYLDPALINAYSLRHAQGIYEGQRAASADKRVFNLTRSAYPGQQRYGTVTWSGDVSATWDTLRRQIADGLSFCVTGMPYWTTDVGAFFVARRPDFWFWAGDYDAGVEDLGYRELYVRWLQYAAWLPILRSHGTDTPREVWRFGDSGDPMYEALLAALSLRYRLLPYIYSLAGWTTHRGYTMLRALPFDFRADPGVFDVADQFMFGPAFLVCPVYRPSLYEAESRPLEDGPRTRRVYLPAGADWFDLWTDRHLAGGQDIEADSPLERIPVFVRAGSIVPMGPVRQHSDDTLDAPLELHVYPGSDASFTLYEDDGDGYDYEAGAFATVEITWDDAGCRLTMSDRVGSYRGMLARREVVAVLHAPQGAAGDLEAYTRRERSHQLIYEGLRISVRLGLRPAPLGR